MESERRDRSSVKMTGAEAAEGSLLPCGVDESCGLSSVEGLRHGEKGTALGR